MTTLHVVSWYQMWLYSPSASLTITSSPAVSGYHRRRHQSRRRSRTVHCVALISRRSVETSCSHGCTDHSSQMPTSTPICSMPRRHSYWKFTRRCLLNLIYTRLGGQASARCFGHCTGCLLNSASTTSLPCLRSRLSRRHLRSIWARTSRCAPAHATVYRHPSHFGGHHLPDDRSALQRL